MMFHLFLFSLRWFHLAWSCGNSHARESPNPTPGMVEKQKGKLVERDLALLIIWKRSLKVNYSEHDNKDMVYGIDYITVEYDTGVGVGGAPFCLAGCHIEDVLYLRSDVKS